MKHRLPILLLGFWPTLPLACDLPGAERRLGALDGVLTDMGAPVTAGAALPAAEKVLAAA